jgi:non-ribosomal peptide synthetase component E (peptide arylation enzyme)
MSDARHRNVSLFLDHQVDHGGADRVAVICGDERVTYRDLLARAMRAGTALREAGVRRDDASILVLGTTP